jgi:maltooligosyltrehalose trehalohydrolase
MQTMLRNRRLPVGAEPGLDGGFHFRVWAPRARAVTLVLESVAGTSQSQSIPLEPEPQGYHAVQVAHASPGMRYRYRLDERETLFPDPASRFQPEGPHAPSELIDPGSYTWNDGQWPGVRLEGQVAYEMHLGTFTPEGTWEAAARELPELASAGMTLIEVMPVAEFHGRFGWGYDGVALFAPTRLYGRPDDFRRFVDAAHRHGLGVILDVVYNHFGPSGNYAPAFSEDYFSRRHKTDWGEAINFDGPNSGPVREFFLANAGYWIEEYHLDGLRLDAVQTIRDDSPEHILAAIGRRVRAAAGTRGTLVIAENEFQQSRLLRPLEQGGYALDAAWNDDFHHAARVAMTGHNEYYYGDYSGTPQELVSATLHGYLYQGQWNVRQQRPRGTPAWDIPAPRFVTFLQNHDQVANSGAGQRAPFLTSPGRYRALTTLWLLGPGTPMFFQGQEFAASSPFLFFADHEVDVARLVREGRQEFLRQFPSLSGPQFDAYFADPCDPQTFQRSKLDLSERERNAEIYHMHRDLLRLRREDPAFSRQRSDLMRGAVITDEAFLLRWFGTAGEDRLLLVNLGRDLAWIPAAEPLVAPPEGTEWALYWSSEDPRYGGSGSGLFQSQQWHLPGHAALVLRPAPATAGG